MKKLNSLSIFIGSSECNGKCKHCAGVPLRKYAPKIDGEINKELIIKTIIDCYNKGARSLSISSSGEPTLSPISITKTLKLINDLKKDGIEFKKINLYSNGILIGNDERFSKKYFELWKNYGLTTIYVTIHSINEIDNAKFYRIESYPSLIIVFRRIHNSGLMVRANLVLSKEMNGNLEEFISTVNYLLNIGVDHISAWPIRTLNDDIDIKNSPEKIELDKIEKWIEKSGYINIKLLREDSRKRYNDGEKLTLFPNGTLSNKWCN